MRLPPRRLHVGLVAGEPGIGRLLSGADYHQGERIQQGGVGRGVAGSGQGFRGRPGQRFLKEAANIAAEASASRV